MRAGAAALLALAAGLVQAECGDGPGRVLRVGPGETYLAPSAAAAVAQDGDTVAIAAGDYRGDVATWRAPNLVLCGRGGRARLFADGHSAQDKAIWVVAGGNARVEDIEFHGARVPHRNGAGIRAEGVDLTIRRSGFFDNENGILGGKGVMTIEASEFARNGHGDGQSHGIYVDGERLVVRASLFREARVGHQLKSRARETLIEWSWFADGPQGNSSYLVDTPNGGIVTLRGNLLHKGPKAENPHAIAFGAEGLAHPANALRMVQNTVVDERGDGPFIRAPAATQAVVLAGNVFAGGGRAPLLAGGFEESLAVMQHNVFARAGEFAGASALDFRPAPALRTRLALPPGTPVDLTHDTPRPLALRALAAGSARLAGAIQSAP